MEKPDKIKILQNALNAGVEHIKKLEKEIDQMRAERPTTLTAEAPPLNSVKLSINAKQQLTGEVKVCGNDLLAAYIEAFKIISIISAKNKGIE